jgi:hypothetical protein
MHTDPNVYLDASKLVKEYDKYIYGKKLLWFLCSVYSMVLYLLSGTICAATLALLTNKVKVQNC